MKNGALLRGRNHEALSNIANLSASVPKSADPSSSARPAPQVGLLYLDLGLGSLRVDFGRRYFLCDVLRELQPARHWPVLPEPGFFIGGCDARVTASRHRIELISRLEQYVSVSRFNAVYVDFVLIVLAILVAIFSMWGAHQLK